VRRKLPGVQVFGSRHRGGRDTDLAPLRPREDFQKFVAEFEGPAQP
jgi:hypothetical protein